MEKKALCKVVARVSRFFRPVISLFSWWHSFRLGTTDIVVIADSTAVFMVAMGGAYVFYAGFRYLLLYCFMLPLLPLVFLAIVEISGRHVKVWRLCCFVPYWVNWVPAGSKFDLYEAWEDPAPSGVAFISSGADPLHLGTAASAEPLYRRISLILGNAGWKHTAFGWEMPPDS